jgi:hypothetical protein
LAKALRPAAVRPPSGSFSRAFDGRLRADFFAAPDRRADVFARFAVRFLVVFFAFDAMRMLSTRLG